MKQRFLIAALLTAVLGVVMAVLMQVLNLMRVRVRNNVLLVPSDPICRWETVRDLNPTYGTKTTDKAPSPWFDPMDAEIAQGKQARECMERRSQTGNRENSETPCTERRAAGDAGSAARSCVPSFFQLDREFGKPPTQGETQFSLLIGNRLVICHARMVAWTVRCASTRCGEQFRFSVRQPNDEHAMMQQRQHHRDQRCFLPAVEAGRGCKNSRRFARQGAFEPEL